MSTLYFLGSRLLARSSQLPLWADDRMLTSSEALFCPCCGEVWARIMQESRKEWTCQIRNCAKHGGGSFIASWRREFRELPPEVLTYEFNLLLSKENEND
jgi:hypothetical protein